MLSSLIRVGIAAALFSAANCLISTKTQRSPLSSTAIRANIIETARSVGTFKTLLTALDRVGLTETLSGPGPFTVFAPSDAAFAKYTPEQVAGVLEDLARLKDILLFHVHAGKMSPTRNGRSLDTLLIGEDKFPKQITIKVTNWECESFLFHGQEPPAFVTNIDVKCDNGFIHVIDTVLIPYEGTRAPKVTFIGSRDKDGGATLQQGFYGPEEGKGLGYLGDKEGDATILRDGVGDTWKVTANYDYETPDGKRRTRG